MSIYKLQIKLLSDTTFGRGDGVTGLVDQEVEHDPDGFPYLRGRTLKGLLSEECDNLVAMLQTHQHDWERVAAELFGVPGSTSHTMSIVHIGDACLPEDLRNAVALQRQSSPDLTPTDILESLTTVRRQTAIAAETGVADRNSLRSARVVLRDLLFTALLFFDQQPTPEMLALLAAGASALRRLGSGRNRGRGHVQCHLLDCTGNIITQRHLAKFGANE
ncbi:RAMP superfamily CRISPR-associated protein [Leptolyngbya sp. AN03gr2]|uniref:RAMP superfamily CRISPR-associated protein n=1 Tax=Leptolyngbya sp. AN03gr2 TaxID=3423364 RepID=UPI003D320E93